ncbi:hypothetical protein GCM10023200_15890 [Actinomycetospora chlora]|uniref:CBS domain-containing protein n=1 Tax=Actinomycetospora chlora TaxID=663608 RepID=A0ABP9AMH1_9PSEU
MNADPGPRRARDLMTSPVLTVPPDAPRAVVAALLVSHGIASAPVVDARGRLLGVVDERGLVGADDTAPAAELMVGPEPVAGPDTPLDELVELLVEAGTRAVPVLREEVPVGIVSRRDVLRRVARGELVPAPPAAGGADAPVVVGVDGSEGSLRALRWAARIARRDGAPLVAVAACGLPDLYGSAGSLLYEGRRVLAEAVAAALGPDAAVRTEAREGRAMSVLVDASRGARLLVLGSRHAEEVAGDVGGSLTARVIGRAACPVVAVVPAPADPVAAGDTARAATAP